VDLRYEQHGAANNLLSADAAFHGRAMTDEGGIACGRRRELSAVVLARRSPGIERVSVLDRSESSDERVIGRTRRPPGNGGPLGQTFAATNPEAAGLRTAHRVFE
jgi:hypothetical protein